MSNTDSKEALAKEDAAVRNLSKKRRLEQKNYSQLTQLLKIKEAQSDIFQKLEEIKNTRNTLPKFLSSPEDIETTQQVNLNYVVQKARGAIASFQQNRLERQLQAKGIDTADLVGAQQQAKKKSDVTQSYINHHRSTGQKLRQQRRTEVLDDFQTRQNGIGKIRDVSSQGFGLANKAFDTGKKLLLPGIKFEQQMSGVQAQLGLDSGDQRLIALRQQATSRAAKGQSAQDVTQAQSALASAGYNPQDVLAAVPAALNLAKASGSSIDEAVKALSGIQQAFQLPADQAENIADVMAKASSSYQLSLSDLDKKMQAAAPAALKNGMGLEQTAAQLAPQGRSLGKVDGAAQAIVHRQGRQSGWRYQEAFRLMGQYPHRSVYRPRLVPASADADRDRLVKHPRSMVDRKPRIGQQLNDGRYCHYRTAWRPVDYWHLYRPGIECHQHVDGRCWPAGQRIYLRWYGYCRCLCRSQPADRRRSGGHYRRCRFNL
ncbi:phage tail tape measure protein, TP901 family, core region [Serratia plymuthica]|uniref:Phage tail tape measure protein, TP901 family, core region n=1 Tax=Serratia plymuthica TaxID=82996 RepID=A0A2X4UCE6_SERPL|nr:phage tail tape measure protein, TP901 family, core region [Serratia plymuthica]